MKLKKTTFWAIISITYLFILKTVNTFIPNLFMQPLVGKSLHILSLAAHVVILLFYFFFLIDYVKKDQSKLRLATYLSIMISAVVVFQYFKEIFTMFPQWYSPIYNTSPFLSNLLYSPAHFFRTPYIPWLNSLTIILFLATFYMEAVVPSNKMLRQATLYALVGSGVAFLFHSMVLIIQVFFGGPQLLSSYFIPFLIISTPIMMLVFLVRIFFLLTFYKTELSVE